MGYGGESSFTGMPHGRSLYGSLPDQLGDPSSFAVRLQSLLAVREKSGIARATQIDVPPVSHKAMLVMIHQLPDTDDKQMTILNFAQEPITGTVRSEHLEPGSLVSDMVTHDVHGEIDDLNSFSIVLNAHEGVSLVVAPPAPAED